MRQKPLFFLFLLIGGVAAEPEVGIRIENRNNSQNTITVLVVGEGIEDLDTYECSVWFDTTVLSLRSAAIDAPAAGIVNILKATNQAVIPMTKRDGATVTIAATKRGDEISPIQSGTLAVLLFEVLQDTQTPVRLGKVSLLHSDGMHMEDFVTHDLIIGGEK